MNQWTPMAAAIPNVIASVAVTLPWPSLFTAQEPVPTQEANGAIAFDYLDVTGLIDIPCTAPPPSPAGIQATEVVSLEEIKASELHHVLLNGYYAALDAGWRGENADGKGAWIALIDGFQYQIMGVESDSQSTMTRVEVKLATV